MFMRIAHSIWALETGGAETMLVDIVNAQAATQDVALFIVNDKIDRTLLEKISPRCELYCIGRKPGSRNPMPWIRLNLELARYKPDVIHFHLEGLRRMVFNPAPKVFTIHNIHTSGREYPSFQALYAISDGVRKYTEKQGFESVTVWNGIRTEDVSRKVGSPYHPGDECRIVCTGRLYTPHKGQDILVEALAILRDKGIRNFHLDFIGDGESAGNLEKMVGDLGLSDKVTFRGRRDREWIYAHLRDYDLSVLPSRSEGFGLSVAEAMCAKVPVLVCDLDGALDVIDGGRLGMTFRTGDTASLAGRIASFIGEGGDERVLDEALDYARTHFDIRITAERYIEEYGKTLARCRK